MRNITKGNEPKLFKSWKSKKDNQRNTWDDFASTQSTSHNIYIELRQKLINQQKKMCCYCEIALKTEQDAHVEHLKHQSKYQKEIFEFNNLLASCQKTDCCGHKKSNQYFENMVSPLDTNCQKRFTYTGNGKIIPKNENDKFAEKTIELLGLNSCKRLKDLRQTIIKTLKDSDEDYLNQALRNCVDWHNGFYTVIEYIKNKR